MFSDALSSIGLAAIKGELAARARRTRSRVILIAVAIILWLLALGFALAALAIWLSGIVGPLAACGIIAGAFAVLALILQLIAATAARREPPLASLFADITAGKNGTDATALGAIGVVLLAGYLLGRRFRR